MRVVAYDPFVSPDRFRELGPERFETARVSGVVFGLARAVLRDPHQAEEVV